MPWTEEEKKQCDDFMQAMPELSACEMALMIQKHCAEVSRVPPSSPTALISSSFRTGPHLLQFS